MNAFLNSKPIVRFAASVLAAGTVVTATTLSALPVIAQGYVPPNVGLPGRTEGGGTRGDCSVIGDKSLTAIAPQQNFGYTTDEYPTFYWYMPEAGAEAAEFVLINEAGEEVYATTFQIQNNAGIISLSIPGEAGVTPLTVGENYQWFFSLVCDFQDRSGDIFTSGWVQRTDESTFPQLASRLAASSEEDHGIIYAEEGIWYNALDKLAEQRFGDLLDEGIEQDWMILLESIGRGYLANEPFVLQVSQDAVVDESAESVSQLSTLE
ncbi:MAG: DUF928 domain-containing protein [Elainellaceae cyanobacterium]